MKKYWLRVGDREVVDIIEIDAENLDDAIEIADAKAEEWPEGGEWGDEGTTVGVFWELYDDEACDNEIESGYVNVDIEPNHDALIRDAGGNTSCDHEWSREDEGGLEENPGVFLGPGDSTIVYSHCQECGLHRKEIFRGPSRNPGETGYDVTYSTED